MNQIIMSTTNKANSSPHPSLLQKYITPKLIKDIKFFVVGVVLMTITIVHYVLIIKKWMLNPDISTTELSLYFGTFAISELFLWYLYFSKFTMIIYKEEIAQYNEADRLRKEADLKRKQR